MPPFLYDLLKYAIGELKTIAHAPVLSLVLLMIGFLLGLWVYKVTHRERLQIASERLMLSEQQLKMSEKPSGLPRRSNANPLRDFQL